MSNKWSFAGYTFPTNPENDTGFNKEVIYAENVPIQSNSSSIQVGGKKSSRRQISGMLFGPYSAQHLAKFEEWLENSTVSTLRDHLGRTNRAMLVSFDKEAVFNVKDIQCGRQSWRYNAEFIIIN